MMGSSRTSLALLLLVCAAIVSATPQATQGGTVEGTVRRAGASEAIADAVIRLEGGPADPAAVQELIRAAAGRGVIFNPKRIGTVDEVIQEVTDVASAAGVGPTFPSFVAALGNFRNANLARFAATSDKDGRFTIKDVPPGQYVVHADREGFINPSTSGVPIRISVSAGRPTATEVSMLPGGTVTGRVRDASGRPLQNVDVQAISRTYQNGYPFLQAVVTKQTDDQGEYRLFWLTPGEYSVAVALRPAPGAPGLQGRVYYPNTLDASQATPLTIKGGDQLSGIDITMRDERLFTISGLVTTTIPPEDTAATAAVLNPAAVGRPTLLIVYRDPNQPDPSRNVGTVELNPVRGTFETIPLPSGLYELYMRIPESNANGGAGLAWGHVPVEIRNENVRGVSIAVHPSVNVSGVVTVDGRTPPAGTTARVFLQPSSNNVKIGVYNTVAQRPVAADKDGKFTIIGVPPGPFHVELGAGLPPELYVADIRQGAASVFDDGVNIPSEAPPPIQVMLRSGASTVAGTVQDTTGKPVAGATVVLMPAQNRRQNRVLYGSATSDAAGKFTIRSVGPGSFKLFAWQQPVAGGAYYNPSFMAKHEERGRLVTVTEGATVTQQITVIP
jgi:protocatechuate 3,4-dioxygenase beta subunit